MRKDGEKYREQTTLRFPVALKKQLQEEAERKGISLNSYILLLIDKVHRCKQE